MRQYKVSRITIPPQTWVEIFDSSTSGSFKTYNFSGRVSRGTSLPTDKGGLSIKGGKGLYSELISVGSDDTNSVYIYNPSTELGYVEKDI